LRLARPKAWQSPGQRALGAKISSRSCI
jgi:hypothetical protein